MPVQIESVAIALYAVYAAAGLQQLVFSLIDADWKLDFYFISFVSSVNCLAIANVLHSVTMFGWWLSFLATFGCFVIILYFEELGLSTGLIFGDYHFTKEMGFSISPNLPALVPVLWCAVIYPSMLLAVGALGTPVRPTPVRAAALVALAATILTGFDVVCEPVSTVFGHQVPLSI